jgi:hypothetical protein
LRLLAFYFVSSYELLTEIHWYVSSLLLLRAADIKIAPQNRQPSCLQPARESLLLRQLQHQGAWATAVAGSQPVQFRQYVVLLRQFVPRIADELM